MRARPLRVVKVGGSLLADPPRLKATLAAIADGADGTAIVVPGGGPFAEAVRAAQAALAFDDGLAHRLALVAMCQTAEVLRAVESRLPLLRDIEAIATASRPAIWAPEALLSGRDDVPGTWDVTSDSLALWLATRLAAERCILVKSAPCPVGVNVDRLAGIGLVDAAFPAFAKSFAGAIVIRGPSEDALLTRDRPGPGPCPRLHPEAPEPSGGLEGALPQPARSLEPSFEATCAAPRHEGFRWMRRKGNAEPAT